MGIEFPNKLILISLKDNSPGTTRSIFERKESKSWTVKSSVFGCLISSSPD